MSVSMKRSKLYGYRDFVFVYSLYFVFTAFLIGGSVFEFIMNSINKTLSSFIIAFVLLGVALLFLGFCLWSMISNIRRSSVFKKNGEVVTGKLIFVDLSGYRFASNPKCLVEIDGKEVEASLFFSFTSNRLKQGQTVRSYQVDDRYILLK